MNAARRLACSLLLLATLPRAVAEGYLDLVEERLTISGLQDQFRARISGTMDLEAYRLDQPSPGLIYTDANTLINPRLSLFVDAQWGGKLYAFAHTRFDRGFDPSDEGAELRLDEYAVRFSADGGRFNVQVGKFATLIGNWVPRHGSWGNPFITAPFPYENLTAVWNTNVPRARVSLLNWAHLPGFGVPADESREKPLRTPIVWGPSYTRGVATFGEVGGLTYALELKSASLSSHPDAWESAEDNWRHPTVSGRLGYRPNEMWNFGFSASDGAYLRPVATPTIPAGRSLGDYRQKIYAQDVSFAWHHLQVWAEAFEARFEIPGVAELDTFSWYAEAKYKFTPQLFGAVRWNRQTFGTIPDATGQPVHWGRDAWRLDFAPTYRLTPHLQLKVQYSLQHESNGPRNFGHLLATQLVLRF